MLDVLKARLARRSALKQVRGRTAQPWTEDPAARRVLVVLPTGEEAREAWRFVKALGLPPRQITPVVVAIGEVTYVPAAYISYVVRMEGDDLNLVGLPKRDFARSVWEAAPDVAFSLAPTFDLASALLVGASPASFRVGLYDREAEPFFDLMIAPGPSSTSMLSAMRDTLRRISPPVLDLGPSGS
jgi:hypothetical protein